MYGVCALALLRLNHVGRLPGVTPRRAHLVLLGVCAVIYSVWAMCGAGAEANYWGAALLAAGLPVYWLVRRGRGAAAA
jgi:APA family basic amino acid/polyamine antiporter